MTQDSYESTANWEDKYLTLYAENSDEYLAFLRVKHRQQRMWEIRVKAGKRLAEILGLESEVMRRNGALKHLAHQAMLDGYELDEFGEDLEKAILQADNFEELLGKLEEAGFSVEEPACTQLRAVFVFVRLKANSKTSRRQPKYSYYYEE